MAMKKAAASTGRPKKAQNDKKKEGEKPKNKGGRPRKVPHEEKIGGVWKTV